MAYSRWTETNPWYTFHNVAKATDGDDLFTVMSHFTEAPAKNIKFKIMKNKFKTLMTYLKDEFPGSSVKERLELIQYMAEFYVDMEEKDGSNNNIEKRISPLV